MPPSLASEKADDIKQFRATLAALYSDAADEHGVAVSMQFFASVGVKPEEAEDVGRTNLGGMQEGALPVWFPDETAAESFFFPSFLRSCGTLRGKAADGERPVGMGGQDGVQLVQMRQSRSYRLCPFGKRVVDPGCAVGRSPVR